MQAIKPPLFLEYNGVSVWRCYESQGTLTDFHYTVNQGVANIDGPWFGERDTFIFDVRGLPQVEHVSPYLPPKEGEYQVHRLQPNVAGHIQIIKAAIRTGIITQAGVMVPGEPFKSGRDNLSQAVVNAINEVTGRNVTQSWADVVMPFNPDALGWFTERKGTLAYLPPTEDGDFGLAAALPLSSGYHLLVDVTMGLFPMLRLCVSNRTIEDLRQEWQENYGGWKLSGPENHLVLVLDQDGRIVPLEELGDGLFEAVRELRLQLLERDMDEVQPILTSDPLLVGALAKDETAIVILRIKFQQARVDVPISVAMLPEVNVADLAGPIASSVKATAEAMAGSVKWR